MRRELHDVASVGHARDSAPVPSDVAVIVLAAGRGRRLGGVAKAGLRLPDGRTFLEAIVETARAASLHRLVIVVGGEHEAVVRALASRARVPVVVNPAPDRGMASSLATGLAAALADAREYPRAVLCWPVDHPRVAPDTVRAVVDASHPSRIVIPDHCGRGGHPTSFGAGLFEDLAGCVDRPSGARAVLADHAEAILRLPVDDPGVVRDVDEPSDLSGLGGIGRVGG